MNSSRWQFLTRCVLLLFGAAALAVAPALAQSSPSPNPFALSSPATGDSSSSIALLRPAETSGGGTAQDNSANTGGRVHYGNWKQYAESNFAFEAGAGFNAPVGNDRSKGDGGPYITWGGNFTVGGGAYFTKRIGLLAEYQFLDNKLPGSLIAEVGTQGGHTHIWSLTLDPVIDLFPKRTNSLYVTGGGGFYRKVTSFTVPEEEEECDYYCGIVVADATVFHFSSNQGGMNFGLGYTHKFPGLYGDGRTKLYAEARYLFVDTPKVTATNGTGTTGLIPITLGVRW